MSTTEEKNDRVIAAYPKSCYFVGVSLVIYLLFAVLAILFIHLNLLPVLTIETLLRMHLMCGAFGMLGASVASIRKYYKVLITEATEKQSGKTVQKTDWSLGWVYYYLTRPLLGTVLGALSFTLSFIGFHVLANQPTIEISANGRYALFALAVVSGFSVSHVLDRLEEVSRQIFQSASRSNN